VPVSVQGKLLGALDAKRGSSSEKGPFTARVAAQNSGDHALTMKASVAFTGEAGRPTWDH
jgi:hypothetical protein